MIETYLKKVNKEDLQQVASLAGVSQERIPYLIYKQYRYAYITEEECFVSRETITYPQLEVLLSNRKEGLVFTLEESDELVEFLNIPEEGPKEEALPEETEIEAEETQEAVVSHGVFTSGELPIDNSELTFSTITKEDENERVDVSPMQQKQTKNKNRKKRNQA